MRASVNMEEFYPAPWPDNVPTIELEKISMAKLLELDEEECARVFRICTSEGFFYLDMLDHPKGRQMYEDACTACQVGRDIFPNKTVEEKRTYLKRPELGVFDRGYFTQFVDDDGLAMFTEYINIPQWEMLTDEKVDFELPPWLAPHANSFKETLHSGNMVANVVLSVLEKELKLPTGTFTDMHRLHDSSSDFLRVLRYPGAKPGREDPLGFPAHKDGTSVSILFTWLGGLQITKKDAMSAPGAESEENWLWVKPVPGCAIVNLGDAMEVFTNQVLKSGKHRVVKAPGAQRPFDKYSVLIGTRPKNDALMKPLASPLIPQIEKSKDGSAPPVLTSKDWGTMKVRMVGEAMAKHAKKEAVY